MRCRTVIGMSSQIGTVPLLQPGCFRILIAIDSFLLSLWEDAEYGGEKENYLLLQYSGINYT